MKIELKEISLLNFKGIREKKVNFSQTTKLIGRNGVGKTTIFDAFTWLLFDKDSSDKKDFGIKTIDQTTGEAIHKQEHEVSAILEVDGTKVALKKVFREKWVKKRGNPEPDFTGHETEYFYDDIPMKKKDYDEKIGYLIEEGLFKLITNPVYFSGLHWKEKRKILMDMAGEVSNADIAQKNPDFQDLLKKIGSKTIEEFKAEIGSKKRKIKQSIEQVPARIDELKRSMPEKMEWKELECQIEEFKEGIDKIEKQEQDFSKAQQELIQKKSDLQSKIYSEIEKQDKIKSEISKEVQESRYSLEDEISDIKRKLDEAEKNKSHTSIKVEGLKGRIKTQEYGLKLLRQQWTEKNAETAPEIQDDDKNCPTCHQHLPAEMIENKEKLISENFLKEKNRKLYELNQQGGQLKSEKEALDNELKTLQTELSGYESEIQELEPKYFSLSQKMQKLPAKESIIETKIAASIEYQDCEKRISEFKKEVDEIEISKPDPKLSQEKMDFRLEIERLQKNLNNREQIEKIELRIEELKKEEKAQANQIAEYEQLEFTILEFMKEKIGRIECKVNSMFKLVTFKMFQTNINGGEQETCIPLFDGRELFATASTGESIKAGIDIISTLCKHYGYNAPIFADNAESISNFPETESQQIRLIHNEEIETLTIK